MSLALSDLVELYPGIKVSQTFDQLHVPGFVKTKQVGTEQVNNAFKLHLIRNILRRVVF